MTSLRVGVGTSSSDFADVGEARARQSQSQSAELTPNELADVLQIDGKHPLNKNQDLASFPK